MSETKHSPEAADESWKDRREFAVWANAHDGTRHRYCLPTSYRAAERTAKELRHSGRTEIVILDFNSINDLRTALRKCLNIVEIIAMCPVEELTPQHVALAREYSDLGRVALAKAESVT